MSFLPGMFPGVESKRPASIGYVGHSDNTSDSSTYTFTGLSVGSAAIGRKVVVGVHVTGVATGLSATYAGNAMTQLGFVDGTNASLGIFAIDETAATTANVVISAAGGTPSACRVWVWNVFNGNSSAYQAQSDIVLDNTGNPVNFWDVTLNCPGGSVVVAVAANITNVGTALSTWTNVTERQDSTLELSTDVATAADTTLANSSSLNVKETWSTAAPAGGALLAVCL